MAKLIERKEIIQIELNLSEASNIHSSLETYLGELHFAWFFPRRGSSRARDKGWSKSYVRIF